MLPLTRAQREYARPGQMILNTLQTNGTLLDDEWGAFLKENEFLVGISVDGPAEIHDTYRVSKGGKPTFERVMRGLQHLKAHSVDWNVLTTVHAANGDRRRAVRPLPDRCLRGVGPARHRQRVRADVRHRACELGGRGRRDVRPCRDLRSAAGTRAQRRPLLL